MELRWPLLLLLLLLLQSSSFQFPRPLPRSLHLAGNKAQIDLSLGQTFRTDKFLEIYKGDGGEMIRGVYAVEGHGGAVQFVDASADVRQEVEGHLRKYGPESVYAVRVQTFDGKSPDALMQAYKQELIKQTQPVGWGRVVVESPFAAAAAVAAAAAPVESSVGTETSVDSLVIRPDAASLLEFTRENVDKVLEEVRPYLIADGGNVAIVSLDDKTRSISLVLQGACGSCASSTTTMKMGIERVLKENFANLGPIISVDPASTSLLSATMIEEALSKILPAIQGMGGTVEIRSADGSTGAVVIGYKGPARLRQGIELVLKDVAQVKTVSVEDLA